MNHRRHHWIALVAGLALLVGACADVPHPTESAAPEGALYSSGSSDAKLDQIARFGEQRSIHIAWARTWIGPEGGRLDFLGFAIEVPPGAVSKRTAFSIHLPVDPKGSQHVVARFGPHGASFNVPVTIEFPLAGTSIEGSSEQTVVWWNGSEWEDVGGAPTADGERLRTTTDHFSEYGTTDEVRRGGISTSGG
jgi:hypothetical protein